MASDEDDLLERLGHALRAPDAEPSPEEVSRLRRAVAERELDEERAAPVWRTAWARRVAAGVAAAAIVLFVVASPPLPRPVRALAHGLGLPVDSVEVADAKSAAEELRAALERGDPEKVSRAESRLRRRLDALGDDDRRRLGRGAEPLLERAGRSSGQTTDGRRRQPLGGGAPPVPAPAVPPGPTTTTPHDTSTTTPDRTPSTTSSGAATTTTTLRH